MFKQKFELKSDRELISLIEEPDSWTIEAILYAKELLKDRKLRLTRIQNIAIDLYDIKCCQILEKRAYHTLKVKLPFSNYLSDEMKLNSFKKELNKYKEKQELLNLNLEIYT